MRGEEGSVCMCVAVWVSKFIYYIMSVPVCGWYVCVCPISLFPFQLCRTFGSVNMPLVGLAKRTTSFQTLTHRQ